MFYHMFRSISYLITRDFIFIVIEKVAVVHRGEVR